MKLRLSNPFGLSLVGAIALSLASCGGPAEEQSTDTPQVASADGIDRTVLPIHEPKRQTYTELDVRDANAPARWEVKAPEGAPNVVVVLIDDMGFGVSGCLRRSRAHAHPRQAGRQRATLQPLPHHGGVLPHTRAPCSRATTTTATTWGRSPRRRTTFPGMNSIRPQTITPMAEVLRQNGFNTGFFGKSHEVPPGRSRPSARRTAGPRAAASRSSTASSAARPTSTRPPSTTA